MCTPFDLQLTEQQAALASAEQNLTDAGAHSPDCCCPLAQQLRGECSKLQAEVEQLRSNAAVAQQQSDARVAEAEAQGLAQLQVSWLAVPARVELRWAGQAE